MDTPISGDIPVTASLVLRIRDLELQGEDAIGVSEARRRRKELGVWGITQCETLQKRSRWLAEKSEIPRNGRTKRNCHFAESE